MMSSHALPDSQAPASDHANSVNQEQPNEQESEILMRAILPQNLNSRIAFNALMIKLLKMYIIIAHCPEFDPDKNSNDSGLLTSAVNWFVTTAKDASAKLGFGESSEAILNLCAELKRDIESAESFEAYYDLCNKLFKEAINAASKSKTPRRVPLFFAIIGLIQQVMKLYYPQEYLAKLRTTRALFLESEKKFSALFNSPNSTTETEEAQHELMRDLIILDDIENYHIIFRRGFNPFPKLFIPHINTADTPSDYLSKPYLSEDELSAMWSILDNQYQAEYGVALVREAMPYYQHPTKNYPLFLNPHFTTYYLFWLNKKTSMKDATESAMLDYHAEDSKKSIKELFESDRERFIARTMSAEKAAKKNAPAPAKQGPTVPAANMGGVKNLKESQPPVKSAVTKDPAANNNNPVNNSKVPDGQAIKTAAPKVVPSASAQKDTQAMSPPTKAVSPPTQSTSRISLAMANRGTAAALAPDIQKVKQDEAPVHKQPSPPTPAAQPSTAKLNVAPMTETELVLGGQDSGGEDDRIVLFDEYDPSAEAKPQTNSDDEIHLSKSATGIFSGSEADDDDANDNASSERRGLSLSQGRETF